MKSVGKVIVTVVLIVVIGIVALAFIIFKQDQAEREADQQAQAEVTATETPGTAVSSSATEAPAATQAAGTTEAAATTQAADTTEAAETTQVAPEDQNITLTTTDEYSRLVPDYTKYFSEQPNDKVESDAGYVVNWYGVCNHDELVAYREAVKSMGFTKDPTVVDGAGSFGYQADSADGVYMVTLTGSEAQGNEVMSIQVTKSLEQ